MKPVPGRAHAPEPEPGTLRTRDGRRADLFNLRHYPVGATCRACGEPISSGSFFRPFEHAAPALATVHHLTGRSA